jgi:uncharacterized protein
MSSRPPVGIPTLSRRSRILIAVGVVVLIGLILSSRLLSTYISFLWYGEVGFRSVFTTQILTQVVLFFAVGIAVGGLVALNLALAYRSRPVFVPLSGPDDPVSRYRSVVVRRLRLFGIGIPVVIGFLTAITAQGDWQLVQLFLNAQPFNQTDPVFTIDIGFFVFQLPFYEWVLNWLFIITALSFFGALITHYLFGGIRLAGRGGQLSGPARIQLSVIAGVFVLFKAAAYFFDRYDLLFSTSGAAHGATYTSLNAVMPAKLILLCIAVFCAIAFFAGAFLRNLQLPAIATVLLILSSLLIGVAWPAVLQQFSVAPNANEKESVPISYNIASTRQAYGIGDDKVTYKPYDNKSTATPDQVKADVPTVSNARLLDPSVVSATFKQLKQGRNFYDFPAKLDIDRYTTESGTTSDYIVAAREMNTSALADSQRNWINQHLVYTHGNGFVAAKANTITPGGYPDFTVSELGSDGKVSQGDIHVDQPRIYYGELETDPNDYAIVGGPPGQKPEQGQEYDTDVSKYTYQGSGGVPIGNWFNRLVFAANYSERNILFNSAIGDDSKILFNRDPATRVKRAAPWLTVDSDPYPSVVNGKIEWIVDGYTTLEHYPYAQQTSLGAVTNDSLTTTANAPRQPNTTISYIRNSVKATVDAYSGAVTLYQVDDQDPVLKAWESVFPGTVKPSTDISPELRKHFRYPEDLFKVQRDLLAKYHVSNSQDFYSNVSFWQVPADPTVDSTSTQSIQQQTQLQPPYYVLSGNPTKPTGPASFQLTSPLVFLGRDFMSAYVSAASDPGPDYGKLTVLQLPSDTQTSGPKLMQTQFITTNGSALNLLKQQSTTVKYGNLLTLPVGNGLLYVEPVYVEQSANQNSSYPQLSRVLVSYNNGVGFAATFADALNQALTGATPPSAGNPPPPNSTSATPTTPTSPSAPVSGDLAQAVNDIQNALANIKSAQSSGDFVALGQAYKALDDATKKFAAAKAAATTSSAPPTTTSHTGG